MRPHARSSAILAVVLALAAGGVLAPVAGSTPVAGERPDAAASATPPGSPAAHETLERPASWQAVLRESARRGEPVVVLFSTPGCAYCEQVRRDHLRHLAAAGSDARVRVVEFRLGDRKAFEDGSEPDSPAALARSLGVRFAPTVAFLGPQGELAERLVGYASTDFYGAYLDERIEAALARLAAGR